MASSSVSISSTVSNVSSTAATIQPVATTIIQEAIQNSHHWEHLRQRATRSYQLRVATEVLFSSDFLVSKYVR